VIPGWLGWGNVRAGLEVYAGTDGDRFVSPPDGPVMSVVADSLGSEGDGAFLVIVRQRLIGNSEGTVRWAEYIAESVGGRVADLPDGFR
jgi:hypothetical protein